MNIQFNQERDGVTFAVKVVPRSHRNEIASVEGDIVKIRLNAPPVDGRANEALVAFLADALDVPKTSVEIVTGHASRKKVVRIRGIHIERVERLVTRET